LNKQFPQRVEELPIVGFAKSLEKDIMYHEHTFDSEYDNLVNENCLELEAYVGQVNKRLSMWVFVANL
jgi:hypothetical protein